MTRDRSTKNTATANLCKFERNRAHRYIPVKFGKMNVHKQN